LQNQSDVLWLSGASSPRLETLAAAYNIGVLSTPKTTYRKQLQAAVYRWTAFDNGAFTLGASHLDFAHDRWWFWANDVIRGLSAEAHSRVLFLALPDAIDVTDPKITNAPPKVTGYPEKTLAWAARWIPHAKTLGVPLALVAGNGMEGHLDEIPWADLEWIFLGGDDDWKLGGGARLVVKATHYHGLKVHMGRVNSGRRLRYAAELGCDSTDGTFLARAGVGGIDRVLRWPDIQARPGWELFAA
jgi:hypothetical protein